MSSISFKFYYDLLSPPSRALITFFRVANIPAEPIPIALRKGEHLTEKYKKEVSRFPTLPCINDNGFRLSESVAIVRYLKNTRGFDDFWYPEDPKAQALVDEYLSWTHNNIRMTSGLYFITKWRTPILTGQKADEKEVAKLEAELSKTLDIIENIWLKATPFIAGDSLSVADVFAACDIEQPRICGFDPLNSRPNLTAWFSRVKEKLDPIFTEHHKFIYKYGQRFQEASKL
ncbi:glutathione S-transferase theta-1-like [Phlebotomus papatasi]|uniref:glutathione S-transferase theta-1-like n=1 Tax=Phlebotomus papatasi TaxID=29031 RepID=UPI002483C0F6|nr:glutathione S-transferase theta-1-like [Phlebotomus papatasi]XP_055716557.1 glutathione S-transferase theta-1-like [Phlebotomus papatasi]